MAILASLFGVLGSVALGLWLRMRGYRRWFSAAARRDDYFELSDAISAAKISIDGTPIRLPGGLPNGTTAFLRVEVRSSLAGRLLDPAITASADGVSFRQTLDRGSSGKRYLNISPLLSGRINRSTPICLRSRHAYLGQSADLVAFAPPSEDGRILVLAPHPDDAEIAAFGLYSTRESWIVTVTAGDRLDPLAFGADLAGRPGVPAAERVADSLRIPQLGGVPPERCVNLVYPDGALKAMSRDRHRPWQLTCEAHTPRATLRAMNSAAEFRVGGADCRWPELVAELESLLSAIEPDVIVAPHPLIDSHDDHIHTTVALAEACDRSGFGAAELYLYVVHLERTPAHPLGSCESVVSMPPRYCERTVAHSVYSHALSEQQRQEKAAALHRISAIRLVEGYPAPIRARVGNLLAGLGSNPASQMRRAARPNEIFFRFPVEELGRMLSRSRDS